MRLDGKPRGKRRARQGGTGAAATLAQEPCKAAAQMAYC